MKYCGRSSNNTKYTLYIKHIKQFTMAPDTHTVMDWSNKKIHCEQILVSQNNIKNNLLHYGFKQNHLDVW